MGMIIVIVIWSKKRKVSQTLHRNPNTVITKRRRIGHSQATKATINSMKLTNNLYIEGISLKVA